MSYSSQPREPKGSPNGGQFSSKGSGGSSLISGDLTELHVRSGSPNVEITSKSDPRMENAGGFYDPDTNTVHITAGAKPPVIAHELGHALDQKLSGDRDSWFSSTSEYSSAWRADHEAMSVSDREYLGKTAYFGSRTESFAELVAFTATGTGSGIQGGRLQRAFPRSLLVVNRVLKPKSSLIDTKYESTVSKKELRKR